MSKTKEIIFVINLILVACIVAVGLAKVIELSSAAQDCRDKQGFIRGSEVYACQYLGRAEDLLKEKKNDI